MTKLRQPVTLYCFTPTVMIATAIGELLMLGWVVVRRIDSRFIRLVLLTLFCLALFQLAEFHTCVIGPQSSIVRLGMVAITVLPVLGLRMVSLITQNRRGLVAAFVFAGILVAIFLFAPSIYGGAVCTGNYVIIEIETWVGHAFGAYYYLFLILALFEGLVYIRKTASTRHRQLMISLMVGYLGFMTPMAIVYTINPRVIAGIPSIMCGFAVFLGLILTFVVVPKARALKL